MKTKFHSGPTYDTKLKNNDNFGSTNRVLLPPPLVFSKNLEEKKRKGRSAGDRWRRLVGLPLRMLWSAARLVHRRYTTSRGSRGRQSDAQRRDAMTSPRLERPDDAINDASLPVNFMNENYDIFIRQEWRPVSGCPLC